MVNIGVICAALMQNMLERIVRLSPSDSASAYEKRKRWC